MRKFEGNYAVKLLELCRQTICLISFLKYLEFYILICIFANRTINEITI